MGHAGNGVQVLGGNQGNAVSVTTYPRRQVLGYRMPIAPTVSALREAGSSEILQADRLQKAAAATATGTLAAEVGDKALPVAPSAPVAPPVVPKVDPSLVNLSDHLTITQKLVEGGRAVANLVLFNRSTLILVACVAVFVVAWWWKRRRIAKHNSGAPVGVAG
jgi:hypothetical protein